jgi:TatD DNase family protein
MMFVDTHCHVHSADYGLPAESALADAREAGVSSLLCVGTDGADSLRAVQFVATRADCWATVGLHPHEAKDHQSQFETIVSLASQPKVVAIGECGLDYYYEHSPRAAQVISLEKHIGLALEHNLPLVFHVRQAFADFWPIVDANPGVRGVVHSFSATSADLEAALNRGLYIGINGIMTFTRDESQLAAARSVPQERLLLETDAPYLTPVPFRGKINEPKHIVTVAKFLATLREQTLEDLASATTSNAKELFGI